MSDTACYLGVVRRVMAVRKGRIRNTVLRQINVLTGVLGTLRQCQDIKKAEVLEYSEKDREKADRLRVQVGIIERGMRGVRDAVRELEAYKSATL